MSCRCTGFLSPSQPPALPLFLPIRTPCALSVSISILMTVWFLPKALPTDTQCPRRSTSGTRCE
ncbi:hypothetical protein BDZ90DRAFT_2489 [Jaminaea rosea]|uniref:Uncharacterized protein n=1 Tax=Jaminaea rosea TaxID=1569628 RepID=A0A316UXE9_9BASI|nr:hypothetical protein BDZ90DRAFT_2489 [Jaminaea rosea]PWN29987.1 hypothetical protein BDZ90DRAFT_2489 [Jaminaea rosea]